MNATHPTQPVPAVAPTAGEHPLSRLRRLARGSELDAVWARPALVLLLAGTAVLYLWALGDSGWGNDFYAAAAQAGSMDWKALLFGSLDPGNVITVDKPPASTWLMGLSVRAFGLSSWSILVPQALCGVAAVWLLVATVRRVAGAPAGLVAGLILAVTPVATLMFRFDNPDALLVLLLVGAAHATTRAIETAGTRWLLVAGSLVGLAFLTKMLQAFVVLPPFALAYLVAAPTPLGRRLWQVLAGGAAVLVSAGWWVALVELWPAGSRPYIGGSSDGGVLDLILGYNGLSRLTGGDGPGAGGGGPGGGGGFGGQPGLLRMFNDVWGGEIAWLLPAALVLLAGGLWQLRQAPRTDPARAALVLWGGWLLVTGLVFSYMSGIAHPYYAVALAPAIGALVAIGGRELLRARREPLAVLLLALAVASTATVSWMLLARTPDWHPWLRYAVAAGAVVAIAVLLVARTSERARAVAVVGGIAAALALGLGPVAYSAATASTPHTGSTPAAGPGGIAGDGPGGGFGGGRPPGDGQGAAPANGQAPPAGAQGGQAPPQGLGSGAPGGAGTANAELVALLEQDSGLHTWAAATVGAGSAAPLQLASGQSVMAIGGFNGGDPAPTLERFQQLVAQGRIHWFVAGGGRGGFGGGGPGGGSGSGSAIQTWVAATYTAQTVGGTTVYDLTQAPGATTPDV